MTSHVGSPGETTIAVDTALPPSPDTSSVSTATASDDGNDTARVKMTETLENCHLGIGTSTLEVNEVYDATVPNDDHHDAEGISIETKSFASAREEPPTAFTTISDDITGGTRSLSPIPDVSEGETDTELPREVEHGPVATSASLGCDPFEGLIKKVSFHIDGDLFIKVREAEGLVLYEVCAANLAAASPVWRRMIYGGNHPCPSEGPWIIELLGEKDDAFGLDIIFSIAHYKYHQIRERYVVSELYGIALVADQYDCTPMLVPWTKEWMAGLYYDVVMNSGHNDNDKTLFVAWVFGDAERLAKVIAKCAQRATIDNKKDLLDAHGRPWGSYGLPHDIIRTIAQVRIRTIGKLIKMMAAPLDHLMKPQNRDAANKFKYCRALNDSDDIRQSCEHLQLGSALSALITLNLHPGPKAEKWTRSAEALAEAYRSIEVARYKVPGVRPHQDSHRGCGFDHAKAIEEIMDAPVKLSASVVAQLKRQALRCGGYKEQVFLQLDSSSGDARQVAEELRRECPSLFKKVVMLSDPAEPNHEVEATGKQDTAKA